MRVFVTDATYKHTLGAVRSLGRKGVYVVAGSSTKYAQSFYSKFCREKVLYPNPRAAAEFARFMSGYLKDRKIDVLLPIGYLANTALSRHRAELSQHTKLPIASWDSMKTASSKDRTMELAGKLDIKVPRMYESVEEIRDFPIVVKGIEESGRVRYVNSPEEFSGIEVSRCILQEYVPGEGYGFFALFNQGQERAVFMHRRVREYPVTGGPSTAAESIYDPKLKALGLKLLKALNWHGVAMVEFKKDSRDDEFKLMEINPKFWGSLELAMACGVDFPYLTAKMATEGDIDAVSEYEVGKRFRWPFPDDFLHLVTNLSSAGAFMGEFFDKNTSSNIWLSDIKPNLFQLLMTIRSLGLRLKNGNLRYPHGIPKFKS